MRILQAVALLSPSGSFGGPTRVSLNQCAALVHAGHDVTLLAGGEQSSKWSRDGVKIISQRVWRFPGLGAGGLVGPGVWMRSKTLLADVDILHVHLSRDLVSLPVAYMALRMGVPVVIQPHGMLGSTKHVLRALLDASMTVPVCKGATAVLTLTPEEAKDLLRQFGPIAIRPILNGVPIPPWSPRELRRPTEVLFLGRLHTVKQPIRFLEAATLIHSLDPTVRFAMVGPDGGELEKVLRFVRRSGLDAVFKYEGSMAYDAVPERLARADIVVLPSKSEVFPMTMLEAMAAGTPVVAGPANGLAVLLEGDGYVPTDGTPAGFAEGVLGLLDRETYRRVSSAAYSIVRSRFSNDIVGSALVDIYRETARLY